MIRGIQIVVPRLAFTARLKTSKCWLTKFLARASAGPWWPFLRFHPQRCLGFPEREEGHGGGTGLASLESPSPPRLV